MRYFIVCLLFVSFFGCSSDQEGGTVSFPVAKDAQSIIDRAIKVHGGSNLDGLTIRFNFRERHYRAYFNKGQFIYARSFSDTLGNEYTDILSNRGLYRKINGEQIALSPKDSSSYANSVNSVIYFALLPYFLNDQAVQKEYIGETTVKDNPYHKIKVSFQEDGGGKDFEDEYIYWIHAKDFTMDYLAYNYQVDGGGARFRESYNIRNIGGVRFADYNNYKPTEKRMDVNNFDRLLEQDSLSLLSKIELEDVEVVIDID